VAAPASRGNKKGMAVGNIETLTAEVAALREALLIKERELYAAQVAALPWKIGDVVMYKSEEHQIIGVAYLSRRSSWPLLVRKRKNGEWSAIKVNPCCGFTAAEVIRHED